MNNINRLQQLLNREYGFSKIANYDFALGRLCVAKEDSWRGISCSDYILDYNPEPPIFSAKFANCNGYRHILAIANEDGKIALQDTTKRNKEATEAALEAPQCHFNAVFDVEWAPGKMSFVSASGDHTARLWEVTNSEIRSVTTFMGHSRSVKTVACRRDHSEVFASGARDGAIIVWDMRTPMKQTSINDNCIQSGHGSGPIVPPSQKRRSRNSRPVKNAPTSSVTGLIFQDANTLISCGASDGIIKIWDLRRNYTIYKKDPQPKYSIPYAGTSTLMGYTNLITNQNGTHLYASCMDSTIYAFNISSYNAKPLGRYRGATIGTFYIKSCLSPDGKYLASGSSDDKAYIWNLEYPDEPLLSLNGHSVEVTCVAWGASHDQPLITCSDDARHKIWRITPGCLAENDLNEKFCGYAKYIRKFNCATDTHKPKTRMCKVESQSAEEEAEEQVVSRSTAKRNLTEFLTDLTNEEGNYYEDYPQIRKRARLLESGGRQLFITNTGSRGVEELPCSSRTVKLREPTTRLTAITEDQSDATTKPETIASTKAAIPMQNKTPPSLLNSPTSNLPNFVLNGEAPHLSIMSPKRQLQVKVDWLTKIRKQKLMMSPRLNLNEKIQNLNSQYNQEIHVKVNETTSEEVEIHSPRLTDIQGHSRPNLTPKRRRRSSHCSLTASGGGGGRAMSPNCTAIQRHTPRTPTSSRRNSETTLLRFFNIQRANSPNKIQESTTPNTTMTCSQQS